MNVDVTPDLGAVPLERLEHEIGELAAHIHAATCRWLLLVGEFDRREGWKSWGAKSCGDWLSWRCGIAPRSAREQVRVGRRLAELPLVCEKFARGELSYSKVRAISRVATEATEDQLVTLAVHATAAQLERLIRAYRGVVSTQVEQANRTYAERFVEWEWDDDGSLIVRGRLPAEDGALLVKALEAGRSQLRAKARPAAQAEADADADEGGSAEPRVTNADAVAHMAETMLANGIAQRNAGERYQLVLHVDPAALSEDAPDARCALEDGPAIPAETARRLACDASLVALTERDGRSLSIGRKTRAIPPAIRRALRSRDRGCRFPGCNERRFVDAHHVDHWAHGGATKLSNLLLLCRRHHRLVHEGGFQVERRAGGPATFRRPDGRVIPAVPRNRGGDARELARRHHQEGIPVTPATAAARTAGDRLDYGMAVEGLLLC